MDVGAWLEGLGLGQYHEVFASNDIDGELLRGLTADDLKELGIASFGHRKRLLAAIADLGPDGGSRSLPADPTPEAYTPRHLAERILGARAALEGERKQVTVLFADVKGSFALIETLDPEDARQILDAAIGAMMTAVHRYEGIVNKVLGDGIMALFGAPIAHEDHAVRACYAALAIQKAMAGQAERMRQSHGLEVSARVGLHSGEVLVRAIGNDLSMDYDAIGPTVHLASRMEQLASPGAIRLTAATARLAEGFLDLRPLGQVPVKGLSQPIEAFDLAGIGAARTRLQAAAGRGLTPFVGRQSELATLERARELAAAGQGQIVALIGDPGVGKSRLFYELTHSSRMRPWLVLEGTSVSSGRASSWAPVVDLLKSYFDMAPGDDRRRNAEKVLGKVLMLDEALKPVLPALLALLELPVEDAAWQALDPPQRRRRTLDGLKALLVRESQRQPLALILEDLHWIDGETQALLDSLVESMPTCRILLLVNYRPEYRHGWGSRAHYSAAAHRPAGRGRCRRAALEPARRRLRALRAQAAAAGGERGQPLVPRGSRAQPRRCGGLVRRARRLSPRPATGRDRGPGERRRDHRGADRPAQPGREVGAAARRGDRRGRAARPSGGPVRPVRRTSCMARWPTCAAASSCTRRACFRTSLTPSGTGSPGASPTTACSTKAAGRCTAASPKPSRRAMRITSTRSSRRSRIISSRAPCGRRLPNIACARRTKPSSAIPIRPRWSSRTRLARSPSAIRRSNPCARGHSSCRATCTA